MGPRIAGIHPPFSELSQSSLEGKGVVRINYRLAGGRVAVAVVREPGVAGHGPALPGVDFIQLSKIRGAAKRQDRDEPRARESGARV